MSQVSEKILLAAGKLVLAEREKYLFPLKLHFDISFAIGRELAERLNADAGIVVLGISFMDLKMGEAMSQNRTKDHVQMGIDAVEEFLQKTDVSQIEQDKIINCIAAHHRDVPFTCIEAEICCNADCYRFLTPKGILGFLHSLGSRGDTFEESLDFVERKMDEKWGNLTLIECRKELEGSYRIFKEQIRLVREDGIK